MFTRHLITGVLAFSLTATLLAQTQSSPDEQRVKVYVGKDGLIKTGAADTPATTSASSSNPAPSPLPASGSSAGTPTSTQKVSDDSNSVAPAVQAESKDDAKGAVVSSLVHDEPLKASDAPAKVAAQPTPEDIAYVAEMKRLAALPATNVPIRSQQLHTVIKLLANAAAMNYVAPDEDDFKETVSLRAAGNPYTLLQVLKKKYSFEEEYAEGMWTFYRPHAEDIIVRTYQLHNNDIAKIKITPPSIATGLGANQNGQNGQGSYGTSGSSTGTNSGSVGSAATNQDENVFENKADEIIKPIEQILKLPVTGDHANIAEGGVVGKMPALPALGQSLRVKPQDAKSAFVQYIPSSNRLVVGATRSEHQIVEEFLKAADQPQRQMLVRVLFVEINTDREKNIGLDPTVNGDFNFSASGSKSSPLAHLKYPSLTGAIVNTASLDLQLHAMQTDGSGQIVNQATVLAINNEETQFSSGLEIPVQTTNYSTPGVSGTQTVSSIQYINIGIDTHVLPRVLDATQVGHESLRLNLAFNVSAQASNVTINGQPFPVVSERRYGLPALVHNGQTLVIGGLVESQLSDQQNKLPIPILDMLFRSKDKTRQRRTLVAYITPILDPAPTEAPDISALTLRADLAKGENH